MPEIHKELYTIQITLLRKGILVKPGNTSTEMDKLNTLLKIVAPESLSTHEEIMKKPFSLPATTQPTTEPKQFIHFHD